MNMNAPQPQPTCQHGQPLDAGCALCRKMVDDAAERVRKNGGISRRRQRVREAKAMRRQRR